LTEINQPPSSAVLVRGIDKRDCALATLDADQRELSADGA